ncbi:hypothetical protein [Zavarzinia marina]|uniref:hypothetical protein n=1 Tax=Zavarzinia marina TaxID=2911065 RepID=UPI001F3FA520|nr:hypothetical protein [Zavarzinia marina]
MGKSFWNDIGFSIRQIFRIETVAYLVLQIVVSLVFYAVSMDGWPPPRLMREDVPLEEALRPLKTVAITGAIMFVLVLPIWLYIYSSLNSRVFGQPVPVSPLWAALRVIKAHLLTILAMLLVVFLPMALVAIAARFVDPSIRQLLVAAVFFLLACWWGWLVLIHVFYFPGTLYHGRFTFREARRLSQGRRGALFGGIAVFTLIMMAFYIPLFVFLPGAGPELASSFALQMLVPALTCLIQIPLIIFVTGHFFLASGVSGGLAPTGGGIFGDAPQVPHWH